MATSEPYVRSQAAGPAISRIGLVVHPSRNIDEPLTALRDWAAGANVEVAQVSVPMVQRHVADAVPAADCDVIVSIGGDGTTLAAIRVAADARRPVLGVACGSLGVLTTVAASSVRAALERLGRGEWSPAELPSLRIAREEGEAYALNDVVVVRDGQGQVHASAYVDGALYARFVGDGCIVSTPLGSSAYALGAGGPLLSPEADVFLLTPLTVHGGFCPPLVLAAGSELRLETAAGHGGARLELDGQVAGPHPGTLTVRLRRASATLVTFADQEPLYARLRRRQVLMDSPRILAEDSRSRG
jgi:NAD+ kinase